MVVVWYTKVKQPRSFLVVTLSTERWRHYVSKLSRTHAALKHCPILSQRSSDQSVVRYVYVDITVCHVPQTFIKDVQ